MKKQFVEPFLCGFSICLALILGLAYWKERTSSGDMELEAVTLVSICKDGQNRLVYDRDTKVMYFGNSNGGYCPLYNSDGSLKLYDDSSDTDVKQLKNQINYEQAIILQDRQ